MSLTKLFTVATITLAGLCNSAEAQTTTVTINFENNGVVGGLLEEAQTVVGDFFTTTVAGDTVAGNDAMGNPIIVPIVIPGLEITTVGTSTDPLALINGTTNNGIGINSDVNSNPDVMSEEAAQLDVAFEETLTFTFNQDVTVTDVEFFGISNDAALGESVSFAGQTLLGSDLGSSDVFTFTPGLFFAANDPIVFAEISGNGVALETFTIVATVPEPGSLAMLGFGSALMMTRRRRR